MKKRSIAVIFLFGLLAGASLAQGPAYKPYSFTTFAGNAASGSVDGPADAARFSFPEGTVVDGAGNIFVADYRNSTIRKITPAGVVSTFAGSPGAPGHDDGTGPAARFDHPTSLAIDAAGNLFVADTNNHTIRKITPAGVVTTFAGIPQVSGSHDGVPAYFNSPRGVALDSAGNVYVSDSQNHTIRKVTPGGVTQTLAGSAGHPGSANGVGAVARFVLPRGLAVDGGGNIYVADYFNNRIRKVSGGLVTTLAGSSAGSNDGTGAAARFDKPAAVALDSAGNIHVADTGNSTVRKITPAGDVSTLAGTALSMGSADGMGSAARFASPYGIAVDSSGYLYVGDSVNHSIRKIAPGGMVTTFAGFPDGSGSADGTGSAVRMNGPGAIVVNSASNVYVADSRNNTIRRVTPSGVVSTVAGMPLQTGSDDGAGSAARFSGPLGMASDSAGNFYIADTNNHTIRKMTAGGIVTTLAGLAGTAGSADGLGAEARFASPSGIAVDSAGNVYIGDSGNNTIRKVSPAGQVITLAGSAGQTGLVNGPGTSARFSYPMGVAADSVGNVFVADAYNYVIRKISSAGDVTTLSGSNNPGFNTGYGVDDGPGDQAEFELPQGVAVDNAGNVYVVDAGANTVRHIAPNGYTNTLAGAPNVIGPDNGKASGALFYQPGGIAVALAGKVYVADSLNNTIRVGELGSAALLNISTRLRVQQGDNVLIGGFIVTGTNLKWVIFRGIGPSLEDLGIGGFLPDPTLELRDSSGALVLSNDNWRDTQEIYINGTGVPPTRDAEAAILSSLISRQGYTAIMRGQGSSTGIGLVEAYGYLGEEEGSELGNISTRGFVDTGNNVMIGGFILGGGTGSSKVIIRAIGPSLSQAGVPNVLSNPTLALHDSNGSLVTSSDNWKDDDRAAIEATGIPPTNDLESAIVATLVAGSYTAIVAGSNGGTGVALVEVYNLQ